MSNCSVTLLLKVGVDVLFFPRQLSGEGGGRRVHWWRWRCVCAYRGSFIHNQLLWARCTAPIVPDGRRRSRRAGAELQPELALRPGSLSFSLSHFPSLSPSLERPLPLGSDSSLSVPPSQSRDCRMFTLRRKRAPTTTLSQIQGSRAPGPLLIGYPLGDWQAWNDWLRTPGPPSGRSDWLLFNLGRAS